MSDESDAAVKRGTRNGVIFLVGLLLIAVVVAGFLFKKHQNEARDQAEMYCAMEPGISSIYSPEYKNCVDQQLH